MKKPKKKHAVYFALALCGAAVGAGLAPSADTLGTPQPEAATGLSTSDSADAALVVFTAPEQWVSGGPAAESENRPCPTQAVSAYEQSVSSRETFTSPSGGEALVHIGVGDTPAAVVVATITDQAALCPPWQVGDQSAEVTNVQALEGVNGVDLTYTAGSTTAHAAWMASGSNLVGITAVCSDAEWAELVAAAVAALQ
jgi:hypothetical protein